MNPGQSGKALTRIKHAGTSGINSHQVALQIEAGAPGRGSAVTAIGAYATLPVFRS